jgi:hypothetical protein
MRPEARQAGRGVVPARSRPGPPEIGLGPLYDLLAQSRGTLLTTAEEIPHTLRGGTDAGAGPLRELLTTPDQPLRGLSQAEGGGQGLLDERVRGRRGQIRMVSDGHGPRSRASSASARSSPSSR